MVGLERKPIPAVMPLVAAPPLAAAAGVHLLGIHQLKQLVGSVVCWVQMGLVHNAAVCTWHGLVAALGGRDLLANAGQVSRIHP